MDFYWDATVPVKLKAGDHLVIIMGETDDDL